MNDVRFTRRRALQHLLLASGACLLPRALYAQEGKAALHVTDTVIGTLSRNFTGLSYEAAQLAHPRFFSTSNRQLVQLFRTLAAEGVLRIGGNTSEYTRWQTGDVPEEAGSDVYGPDPGYGLSRTFIITPRSIDNLTGFLEAANWSLIYGLNLAKGETAALVDEARYVMRTVGRRLIALQIGNEPDLFKLDTDRTKHWTYDQFISRWKEVYAAIRKELPDVPIAGPDTSGTKWNAQFAEDAGGKVIFETGHYYAEGPPSDPRMTLDYLLHPGAELQTHVLAPIEAAAKRGKRFRMTEGNTCYAGGKAGVSDTFASALWVADLMSTAAAHGALGVNFHGGGNGLYTPIAGSPASGLEVRPEFYGILAFRPLLGGSMLESRLDAGGLNLSAIAVKLAGQTRVLVINRDAHAATLRLSLLADTPSGRCPVWRLAAPDIESKGGVTWAGAQVSPSAPFAPGTHETLNVRRGVTDLELPPYSAALLFLRSRTMKSEAASSGTLWQPIERSLHV